MPVRSSTESGSRPMLWLLPVLLLLGGLTGLWFFVLSETGYLDEQDPLHAQAGRVANACLEHGERLVMKRGSFDANATLDSLLKAARESGVPLDFLDQAQIVRIDVDGSGGDAPLVLLSEPEPQTACALRMTAEGQNITVAATAAVPFDWSTPPAESFQNAAIHTTVKRRFQNDVTTEVIARSYVEMAPDAAVLGPGGLRTHVLKAAPGAPQAGCICGPRSAKVLAHVSTCPPDDCAPSIEIPFHGVGRPQIDVVRPRTWRTVARPGNVCSFYLRDSDVFLWDTTDTAHGCDTAQGSEVRPPCGAVDTCAAAETACWKKVATLDGKARSPIGTSTREHTVLRHAVERFAPQASEPIPNVADSSARWPTLCGSCPGCDERSTGALWHDGGSWRLDRGHAGFPERAILFFENAPGYPVVVSGDGLAAERTTLVASASVVVEDHASLASAAPGIPAIQAGGRCFLGSDVHVEGDLSCETIHVRNASATGSTRIHGALSAWLRCSEGKCPDREPLPPSWEKCSMVFKDFDCDNPGICIGARVDVRGVLRTPGDICIDQQAHVDGSLLAGDDVGLLDRVVVEGRVFGGDTVGLGSGVIVRPGRETPPAVLLSSGMK